MEPELALAETPEGDDLIGRSMMIAGKPWTVMAKASWADYYYLCADGEREPIIRPSGMLRNQLAKWGGVDPND